MADLLSVIVILVIIIIGAIAPLIILAYVATHKNTVKQTSNAKDAFGSFFSSKTSL